MPETLHQSPPSITAKPFLLKTLLWLPVCFIAWHSIANWLAYPAILLSEQLLRLIMPGVIESVEPQGYLVSVITQLSVRTAAGDITMFSQALNVLKYSCGLPLILAMSIATPYSLYSKGIDFTYSLIAITFIQTWGICFESISLLLNISPSVTTVINKLLPYTQHELFINYSATGKALGSLFFPVMVPVAIWINRHKGFLEQLAKK